MKIRISTDSTADIPKQFCDELQIAVLPLTILYEGKEYRDGVDITEQEIYDILETCTELPQSAQVKLPLYEELYLDTWKKGYTDLIHISINSKGSGTFQAGVIAKEQFFEDYPEAVGQLNIHNLDSLTYSMAYGIPVIEAAQMAAAGKSVEEILANTEDWIKNTRPMFVPLDLKCVKKSGRISPTVAFVGDALGLKPLITFEDGYAKTLMNARGEKKAIQLLVDTCMKERKPGTNYALVYGKNMETYGKMKDLLLSKIDMEPICEYPVGCIIGMNTGPNMMGILYRK